MCMLKSLDDINIETAEPESKTQVPESEDTEAGPGTEIRKQSTVAMSPTRVNNDHLNTPDTVQSPDIGSMIRPYRPYAPTTPTINIRTVPVKFRAAWISEYLYIYNATTVDKNIFTKTAEREFNLSHQFENKTENDITNNDETEIQSVSENDNIDNNEDENISDGDSNRDNKSKSQMKMMGNKQICLYKVTYK